MQDRVVKRSARMVRKQILITPEQNRRLKALARSRQCGESEIVRASIDQTVGLAPEQDDWKHRLLAFAGQLGDADADPLEAHVRESRARWRRRLDATRCKLRSGD